MQRSGLLFLASRVQPLHTRPISTPTRIGTCSSPAIHTRRLRHDRTHISVRSSAGPEPSGKSGDEHPTEKHERSSPTPAQGGGEEPEELKALWENVKAQMKGGLSPEEAKYLEEISIDDITSQDNKVLRKLAQDAIGPLLESVGSDKDPLAFFFETISLATFLQFVTCGMMFYGTEVWGHFDGGEAARAVLGLVLGYVSRPFLKVETLLAPVYNSFLSTFVPGAVYSIPEDDNKASAASTLNTLGVCLAVAFFAPKLLWGWQTDECLQLVLPLCSGWFLFDVVYMGTLLWKIRTGK